jgi:hypothetical protein
VTALRPGDTVRVLDTGYTRSQSGAMAAVIGDLGEITAVTTSDPDMTGFDAIYDVRVGPYDLALIAADVELIARPARITG